MERVHLEDHVVNHLNLTLSWLPHHYVKATLKVLYDYVHANL